MYAAAALYNNPFADTSPFRYPDLASRPPQELAEARLGPRSALYEVFVRRHLTLVASLPTGPVSGTAEACAIAVYSEGHRLLSSDADGRYVQWDLVRKKALATHRGPPCPRSIDVSPDGRTALILARNRTGQLMRLDDGSTHPVVAKEPVLRGLTFGPSGASFYAIGAVKQIVRLRTEDFEPLAQTTIDAPRAVTLGPSGQRLAVGTRWGAVHILDAVSLEPQARFRDHRSTIWALAFSHDGRQIAAGGYEGFAIVRNLESAAPSRTTGRRGSSAGPVKARKQTAGGKVARFAADLRTGFHAQQRTRDRHRFRTRARLAYPRASSATDVHRLSPRPTASRHSRWHEANPHRRLGPQRSDLAFRRSAVSHPVSGHAPPTYGFASRGDGRRIATSDGQNRIRVWTTEPAKLVWTRHEPTVWALAWMGDTLVSASSRGRVTAWSDIGERSVLQPELPTRRGSHVSVAAVPGRAAWTGAGGEIVVYDGLRGRIDGRAEELTGQSSAVALSNDGRLLAAADTEGHLVLWGLSDRVVRWRQATAHRGIISGLSFSPDGETLASAGRDGVIHLWQVTTGNRTRSLKGHGDWINQVAFSPDGAWLASGSDDGSARLWSIASGHPSFAIVARSQVNAVGFINGQQRLVVGRDEQFLSVPVSLEALDLPVDRLLAETERSAGLRLDGFELKPEGAAASSQTPH